MDSSSPIKIPNSGFSGFQTEIPPYILPEKTRKSGFYYRPIRNDFFLRAGRDVQHTEGGIKPAKQSGKGNNRDALVQIRNLLKIKQIDVTKSESLTHYFNLRT